MQEMRLGVIESRFADIIWEKEPIATGELVKICEKELGWKRTTTYTVLKRLSERGLFQNDNGTVTSLLSKQEFHSAQSEQFVEEHFGGSLPAFLAAFTARKELSGDEVEQIRKMIDSYGEE
ncbi:MAG: BlaI/MecI/CopY family transcriptional regulator [Lachnospiraceae bacterium]|nr:BlaI/MecI/CopY family transcriptional regulator [Lachnospiraceae bacterium]